MISLNDINSDNWHLYKKNPDKDFSIKKNYHVINQVLEENDKMQNVLSPKTIKEAGDRADILASYGVYRFSRGTKKIEEYLGKQWMSKIYGEQLIEKIRVMDSIRRLNKSRGNTKFENFYMK